MPLCVYHTNVSSEEIPDEIVLRLCKLVAETLDEDVKAVTVEMRSGKKMCRDADLKQKWGFFELHGTGAFLDTEKNLVIGNKMFEFGVEVLDVPRNCLFVMMHEHEATCIGIPGDKLLVDIPKYANYSQPDYFKGLRNVAVN